MSKQNGEVLLESRKLLRNDLPNFHLTLRSIQYTYIKEEKIPYKMMP